MCYAFHNLSVSFCWPLIFEQVLAITNFKMGVWSSMPLTMAKPGETVTIRRISGRDETRRRLAELGLAANSAVTVVSEIAGSLILQVKDSRVALDRAMASRVII